MKIKIEGWSGVNHSYSIVAESYVKGLIKNDQCEISFYEKPYYMSRWRKTRHTILDDLNVNKNVAAKIIRSIA